MKKKTANLKQDDAYLFKTLMDPHWVRSETGGFFSFLDLDPEERQLTGVGGVFLIFHAGIHPEWVYVGHSKCMATGLHNAGANKDILSFEVNGGLFVAWAPVLNEYRKGVVKYIDKEFKPQVLNPGAYIATTRMVPVLPPAHLSSLEPDDIHKIKP
ncbi:MAG: hypothetical protein JKY92_09500 [Magnetovibrio sp.]|nr:hypothetical protein [Magnetovibrio sp.]